METNETYHIKLFNDRVRAMNQTGGKVLTLNTQEARSLQADIYDLMATIARLSQEEPSTGVTQVVMDGGSFK